MTVDEHRRNIAVAVRNLNEALRIASHDKVKVSIEPKIVIPGGANPVVYATLSLPC